MNGILAYVNFVYVPSLHFHFSYLPNPIPSNFADISATLGHTACIIS